MKLAVICAFLVVGVGAFAAGWVTNESARRANSRLDNSEVGMTRAPLWATPGRCREASAEEQHQHRLALEVLEVFDTDWLNALQTGAVRHFAHPWRQRIGGPRESFPCPPIELHDAVTRAAIKAKVFARPFLYEDGISLAEQLGPRDPQIVDAVARTAFHEILIPDDPFGTDLRPYARLVLAEFGSPAKKWAGQALAQLSANDQLGTGAAQIAVAGGEPRALPAVQNLMAHILTITPVGKPIPRKSRNQLYELAFALGMAGEDAQPYGAPLIQLLDRTVESWAPPFGMVHLQPARMCAVAEHIGGNVALAARTKAYCTRMPQVFEK
jgi:hypothetical protein